jgi:hypothetical protein
VKNPKRTEAESRNWSVSYDAKKEEWFHEEVAPLISIGREVVRGGDNTRLSKSDAMYLAQLANQHRLTHRGELNRLVERLISEGKFQANSQSIFERLYQFLFGRKSPDEPEMLVIDPETMRLVPKK